MKAGSEKLKLIHPKLEIENAMDLFFSGIRKSMALSVALMLCLSISVSAAGKSSKKKNIPIVEPKPKVEPQMQSAQSPGSTTVFQELNFNKTLVIEGKVEKPQVQFTLLKEPPPEKEILFETSFLKNILKMDRENTFKVGDVEGQK